MADKPVLWLKTKPRSEKPHNGGSKKIVPARFSQRQEQLLRAIDALVREDADGPRWFARRALFWVGMDAQSQAASHLPDPVFARDLAIEIVAPWRTGYVVEIPVSSRDALLTRVREPSNKDQKISIARIRAFRPLHEVLTQTAIKRVWRGSAAGQRRGPFSFTGYLPPFRSPESRAAVVAEMEAWVHNPVRLRLQNLAAPLTETSPPDDEAGSVALAPFSSGTPGGTDLLERLRAQFVAGAYPSIQVSALSWEDLWTASGRGLIVRWDPISPLAPARPGVGADPDLDRAVSMDDPVVGLIDGGHSTNRYRASVVWEEGAFPLARPLDLEHGNIVAGLIAEGYAWSSQLDLPPLNCRLGIVPAVPKPGCASRWDPEALVAYLDGVFSRQSDTKVWNLSANTLHACNPDCVSELGHRLSLLARKHRILLVIATGNRPREKAERVAPPADAEAAVVVAGRMHDLLGTIGGPCPVSRTGLGPGRMRKPDLSWFSTVRVLGGRIGQASSWATPLVSSVAAHTWKALVDPSPDLVRAILLATTEHNTHDDDNPRIQRKAYDHRLRFGSPMQIVSPRATPQHAILLVWRDWISEKNEYYWGDIHLPASLTRGGVFRGHARLVCVLSPRTHQQGTNYCSTRVEASLQYETSPGKWKQLIGGLATKTPEGFARSQDAKWEPIRFYTGTFGRKRKPPVLDNPRFQVRARLYWRDRYLYPSLDCAEQKQEVTFAVLLESLEKNLPVHDEFVKLMGESIESAVMQPLVHQDQIENISE